MGMRNAYQIDAKSSKLDSVKFKREYEILKKLSHPNIITAKELTQSKDYFRTNGQIDLYELVLDEGFSEADVIKLGLKILNILEFIWQKDIVFNNINPSSFYIDENTSEIKLVNFKLYSEIGNEFTLDSNISNIEGNIFFISPEQTGRMNRCVDYRSDIYSLGALLHYLMTKNYLYPEFSEIENNNVNLFIHSLLTKNVELSNKSDGNEIHPILKKIILKMTAKNVEDRYQSVEGLKVDLNLCLSVLRGNYPQEAFILGELDRSKIFRVDDTLRGRNEELEKLIHSYRAVVYGQSRLVLVSGHSGIGKTALVNEVKKPITEHLGLFISGKFDQLKRNIPFYGLKQALSQLVDDVFDDNQYNNFSKEELIAKIDQLAGNQINLLLEIIPSLKKYISTHKDFNTNLTSTELQNLYNITLSNFIGIFKNFGKPLVLFLDDLQWADASTMSLIKYMITNLKDHNLMIITGYRDNEVGVNHPWQICINEIQELEGITVDINLKSLDIENTGKIITSSLGQAKESCGDLIAQVFSQSEGNPFYVQSLLKSYHSDGLITFNGENLFWNYDIASIIEKTVATDLVEVIIQSFSNIDDSLLTVLQSAASIGAQFNLSLLTDILKFETSICYEAIKKALNEKYIISLDKNYRYAFYDEDFKKHAVFKFSHDKIQQALYESMSLDRQIETHKKIAKILKKSFDENQDYDVFDLVFHFNKIPYESLNFDEKSFYIKLNYSAGKKAYESTAYSASKMHLELSYEKLPEDSWHTDYDFTLAVSSLLSETYYLSNMPEKAEPLYDLILMRAKTKEDKAKIFEILMNYHTLQGRSDAAISTGKKALALYGISFPEKATMIHVFPMLLKVKFKFLFNDNKKILNNRLSSNQDSISAVKILANMSPSCFIQSPESMLLNCLHCLDQTLTYGNSDVSSYAISLMGFVEAVALKNYKRAHELVVLASELNKKLDAKKYYGKVIFAWDNFVQFYHAPIEESIGWLHKGHAASIEAGDFNFASYCLYSIASRELFIGTDLYRVYEEVGEFSQFCFKVGDKYMLPIMQVLRRFVISLTDLKYEKYSSIDENFDIDEFLEKQAMGDDKQTRSWFYIYETIASYLHGRNDDALKFALLADEIAEKGTQKQIVYFEFYFYSCLISIQTLKLHDGNKAVDYKTISKVKKLLKKSLGIMKFMSEVSPVNFRSRYYLCKAEYLSLKATGFNEKIIGHYLSAIAYAIEDSFLNIHALSCELLSAFYFSNNMQKNAVDSLEKSISSYKQWGFKSKYSKLQKILQSISKDFTAMNLEYDQGLLLELSRSLSAERNVSDLMDRVNQIAITYSNAQEGMIIRKKSEEFILVTNNKAIKSDFPRYVIDYIYNSKKIVRIDDATSAHDFYNDDYFKKNCVHSVLALPLLANSEIKGVLYLENKDLKNVFVDSKIRFLELLSTQIALSIDNALFLEELEDKILNRTQMLEEKTVELTRSNSEKDVLVRVLCHDLANMVTVNMHSANMLGKLLFENESPDIKKHLLKMKTTLKNQSFIINNIRTLEMAKNKLLTVDLSNVDLCEKIQESLLTFEERILEKKLQIVIDNKLHGKNVLAEDVSLGVNVINNVLSNAIKFSYPEGRIEFNLDAFMENYLILEIKDFGVGMPKTFRDSLFKSDVHHSSHGTSNEKGSGFGLNILKVFMEKFNGEVLVHSVHESESDKHGTSFKLKFLCK